MITPDEVRNQLADCFLAVFPELDDPAVRDASTASVPDWDSLASISLVAVIEEEFDLELPEDDIKTMTSFDAAAAVLHRLVNAAS